MAASLHVFASVKTKKPDSPMIVPPFERVLPAESVVTILTNHGQLLSASAVPP